MNRSVRIRPKGAKHRQQPVFVILLLVVALLLLAYSGVSSLLPVDQDAPPDTPNVGSAVLIDSDGNILFSKAGDERRYPASTTKILTALIAVEIGDLNDLVRVGDEANLPKLGSSIAGLRYGEQLTLEQLLNALLIPSGNDAAYVIATYIGRKISGDDQLDHHEAIKVFVQRMNSRAKELGAKNSHFVNPDGYHDENHYTTATDMARIALEAMRHVAIRQIVARTNYALPAIAQPTRNGRQKVQPRILENTNKLLDQTSPYYLRLSNGVKTGHTTAAGYCLISSAVRGEKSVLAVVMKSSQESIWQVSSKLLQWGLAQL
jgi:D-alanyl-D-alanine carboxypeptidase (penicillin-binding protein 5/6)